VLWVFNFVLGCVGYGGPGGGRGNDGDEMTDNPVKELQATSNILGQMAERARVLKLIDAMKIYYSKNSKERQVLDVLRRQVEGGALPNQGSF
jgi:hypothetical protein